MNRNISDANNHRVPVSSGVTDLKLIQVVAIFAILHHPSKDQQPCPVTYKAICSTAGRDVTADRWDKPLVGSCRSDTRRERRLTLARSQQCWILKLSSSSTIDHGRSQHINVSCNTCCLLGGNKWTDSNLLELNEQKTEILRAGAQTERETLFIHLVK